MPQKRPRYGRPRNSWLSRPFSVILICGITSTGLIGLPAAATAAAPAAATADPVADGSKSEEEYALEQAAATGRAYELVSARTESTDTWAQPDGTWSVKRYGTPVRLLRDGAWVPTDPGLAFAADGAVVPKASTVDVTFSGGGTGPLLTGVKDGRALSLTWTKALPKPTLAENVATYSEVLPGVDLQLKAEVEGFSQLLVVKTAAAAENPELASLKYKLDTVGLDVSTDTDTGSVSAVNPAGQTVFSSPSPLMWDSSSISSGTASTASSSSTVRTAAFTAAGAAEDDGSADDSFDPPPGTQDAQMPTTVSGDTLEIKPDQDLLTGDDTTYPVFIDPSWAWGEKQNWTRVYKHYPSTSFWNTKDPVRVGYEAETGGSDRVSRSFLQLDTSDTRYAQIKGSVLRVRNTWSWSCQSRPVELWLTSGITKKTTWNHQPAKKTKLDTVNDSKGWSKDCAAGNLEFDTTAQMKEAAAKGWSNITLGLYASDESDTFGWKKFDPKTAVLETKYNNPPKTPTSLGTNPRTDCKAGGLIGNTRVSLYAKFDDKDAGNLTAEFQVFKSGATTPSATMSLPANKGRITTWAVPDANLPTGDWTWKTRAKDQDGAYSAWSATCKFTLDRTRPSKPPVISSQDGVFPSGENGWPSSTGKARDTGKFAFAANGVTDVDHYVWWTDYDPEPSDALPGIPATVRPPGYGPHFVYAYSVDKTGNRSDTATYVYYAGRSQDRDGPTDLNGDANSDIWSTDSNGTLLTYAGQGNGDFAAATNGGKFFDGADVDSRGDWGQDGYNDLVALEYDSVEKKKRLWTYPNNGSGVIGDDYTELTVSCPVVNEDLGCIGDDKWTGDDHWHNAEQIVAAGDLNGDTAPDLLVKQGKFLWAYYGNRAAYSLDVREPVLVGAADWDKFTVIAPGDLNGDKIADLWLREDATGDIYRSYGKKGANGYLDPTTWGNTAARVKIAVGYQASAYPSIGSVGDVTGDGLADLWARKNDNTMLGWPGKVPGSDNKSFGTVFVIDGITGGSRIPAGTTLAAGQSLSSRSAKLTMQDDGNLVIASNAGKALWSSKTSGNAGAKAVMRGDGNLVVYKADGTTVAWESKTNAAEGYAMLQDRGDLVVFNIKSQSLWSSGSSLRHDYNADGRSDMADWYDYADGHDSVHSFATNSDGTFASPKTGWTVGADNYAADHMKRLTGDFNGDGIGDVAAVYGYDSGAVALFTWTGKGDGTFNAPFKSWNVPAGSWTFGRMTPYSGDFNGDGRDDVAVWYDYADKHDTVWTFTSTVRGGFNSPVSYWTSANSWEQSRAKTVTGDFNGDGRDDLAAFYGYADGSEKIWTFSSTAAGKFVPVSSWSATTWGDWARTTLHAGDFNGDGRDDVAAWYDYADGHDGIVAFPSTATGTFTSTYTAWSVAAGSMWRDHMKIVTGDFNGDGRDDFGAFYGYDDGSVRMFTMTAKTDGTLNAAVGSWSAPAGNWTRDRAHFLEQQN
ncbi:MULTISPECIES: FG-GAP-like repeat-containing protein [unclassified Streptomyces]|uniref:FG-GAP-like repeat-containing protein n=1 Tax=unclassified Streptomyces TaxID=2593676 RepID=UPI00225B5660|nr:MULTISPECIES: FG-GAP-like repeat-containing protein [unclassified Streptomyces]MCX4990968.1 FG-GAP-like repeat-containing protein [Streptomyces sp. NBC_00568]MCX5003801.1 FG-GAP-like repeat-containing protein [Streptomyces sp. NBC_00638]